MRILCTLVLLLLPFLAAAQSAAPTPPCSTPEFTQFDFWVGEWEANWEKNASMPAGKGTNHITKTFDGCVIEERFDGAPTIPLKGMSVSTFNPRSQQWQQTWVDNQGSYLDFDGGMQDGQMILVREATAPNGAKVQQRMVWKNIAHDSFDWSWESSRDGGKTWQVNWAIKYQRKAAAAR